MSNETQHTQENEAPVTSAFSRLTGASSRRANAPLFALIVVLWLLFDVVTKYYFNQFALGELIAGPFLGIFQFRLVHNIGAAWGIFGGAVVPLGILSLVVCAAMAAYLFIAAPQSSKLTTVGAAFIVSGGIGNAIDRFSLGYVVDFIEPVFIEFPVFNIADIGVTCGFVLFFIGMLFEMRREVPA